MNKNYYRKFITLDMEGRESQKSFGTAVIEARNGNGKVSVNVENIRINTQYIIELVKVGNSKSQGVSLGIMDVNGKGHGIFKADVDSNDVMKSGLQLDEFDLIAVKIKNTKELITPLVGYYSEKKAWKGNYVNIKNAADVKHNENLKPVEKIVTKKDLKNKEFDDIKKKADPESNKIDTVETPDCGCGDLDNTKIFPATPEKNNRTNIEEKSIDEPTKKGNFKTVEELLSEYDSGTLNEDALKSEDVFVEMVEKLKEELKELKKITEDDSPMELDKNSVFDTGDVINVDYLFKNNKETLPFSKQNKDVDWIEIDLDNLALLPNDSYKYIRNKYFRNSYQKFGKLILGKYFENEKEIYLIGVPDFFQEEKERDIRKLGFIQFKCIFNEKIQDGVKGYWIKVVKCL